MIIIVHGPPASGKSTLAEKLSAQLDLPHISRDKITEWLMEAGKIDSDGFFKFIGNAGYELMFNVAEELSKGRGDFIVEGSLNPEGSRKRFEAILGNRASEVLEVFLSAPNEVLVERYHSRTLGSDRHLAHNDTEKVKRIGQHLKEVHYRPMGFAGLLEIDGTEPKEAIFTKVAEAIQQASTEI